jgi:DNA-binding SARP family transcriptional activator/sugar lactone lactonase YvrE
LYFRILGPLEIEDDSGRLITPPGRTARALLELLLLEPNTFRSTTRLIDDLWPDEPPANAAKALQIHVSRLRKTLGGGRLETLPGGYRLRVRADELDWARAQELVERGQRLLRDGDPAAACDAFASAESLFRGDPLGDLSSNGAAAHLASGVEDVARRAAEGRIEARLELGAHAEVIRELRTLVARHPERERLHALLMLALYRTRRQSEALEVYRDAATYLDAELGLLPGPELRELERRILQQDPELEAGEPPPAGHPRAARSRRRLVASVAAIAIAAAAALVAAAREGGDSTTDVPQHSLAVLDGDDLRLVRTVQLGAPPADVAVGPRASFAALPSTRSVAVVVHATGATSSIGSSVRPSRLAAAPGAIWVLDGSARSVARLGSGTSFAVTESAGRGADALDAIAADARGVWLAERNAELVFRLDPRSGKSFAVDNRGRDHFFEGDARRAVTLAHGSFWATNPVTLHPSSDRLGRVSRIDLATQTVTARIRLPAPPVAIAATEQDVWVALERGDSVWRIDPRDDVAASSVPVGSGVVDLAADGSAVWALGADGRISRVDPAQGEVVATVTLSRPGVAIAARDGTLFVAVR